MLGHAFIIFETFKNIKYAMQSSLISVYIPQVVLGSTAVFHACGPRDYMSASNEVSGPARACTAAMLKAGVRRLALLGGILLMQRPGIQMSLQLYVTSLPIF